MYDVFIVGKLSGQEIKVGTFGTLDEAQAFAACAPNGARIVEHALSAADEANARVQTLAVKKSYGA